MMTLDDLWLLFLLRDDHQWHFTTQLFSIQVQIIRSSSSQPKRYPWGDFCFSHWVRSSLAPSNHISLILASGHPPLDLDAILPLLHLFLDLTFVEDAGDADTPPSVNTRCRFSNRSNPKNCQTYYFHNHISLKTNLNHLRHTEIYFKRTSFFIFWKLFEKKRDNPSEEKKKKRQKRIFEKQFFRSFIIKKFSENIFAISLILCVIFVKNCGSNCSYIQRLLRLEICTMVDENYNF